MRRLTSVLCMALLALPWGDPALAQSKGQPENLLAAMKLWGDIKFFDPQIAGGKVDWDAALTHAEPAILSSKTPEAYRTAIGSMLAPLGDPATHVDAPPSSATRGISANKIGNGVLITVPHGVSDDKSEIAAGVASAVDLAAKSSAVAIDLRNVTEASAADAAALRYLFSPDSPVLDLVAGSLTLPRERSRSYLGYPSQSSGGYQGYSALDSVTDGVIVTGKSKVPRRFAILVDGATSLPSMALALSEAGDATIYTNGGDPTILAPAVAQMKMPYGVRAVYRTGDLADIGQPLALPAASSPEDAIAKLPTLRDVTQSYPRRDSVPLTEKAYSDVSFPAEPMRMLAIARIYNVIRYFSPYADLMHDDWDAATVQAIDDERNATDARSYLLGLMKFYAHLHDSHGFVGGDLAKAEFGAGVPFLTRYLYGQAVVTSIAVGYAGTPKLRDGDVIDAVNGVPIHLAMSNAEKYLCESTPQAANSAALGAVMGPSAFTGKKGTPITITFHDLRGERQTITLSRDTYSFVPARSGPKYFILPGNVGYVDFDRIEQAETDAMFDALKNTRAIVFDNRGYPRGAAWTVAPRLTTATGVRAALFDTPLVTDPLDVQLGDISLLPTVQKFYQLLPTSDRWKYLKPTVMLIDERAISQSEHSALFFRAATHTLFVGTPTNGADGDVTSLVVPGGLSFHFSGEGVRHPNGDQLQRVGIRPDVYVEPTAADIGAGNDVVLRKGLEEALLLAGSTQKARDAALRDEIARERRALTTPQTPLSVTGKQAQALTLPWTVITRSYVGTTSSRLGYSGSDELTLASSGAPQSGTPFGSFTAPLDIGRYRGKTIRIRGYLSSQDVSGAVGFWLRIDGPSRQFDNMRDRWLSGTSGWKPFAIILRVPLDATGAYCGLLLVGAGTAHASGLTIDVVPDSTPTTGD
jgi:C-terminal processing protease CtpA/Prc